MTQYYRQSGDIYIHLLVGLSTVDDSFTLRFEGGFDVVRGVCGVLVYTHDNRSNDRESSREILDMVRIEINKHPSTRGEVLGRWRFWEWRCNNHLQYWQKV